MAMTLEQLIAGSEAHLLQGGGQVTVDDLTDDSRRVRPGSLFVARRGPAEDGCAYIRDALARGAAAVLAPTSPQALVAAGLGTAADFQAADGAAVPWAVAPAVDQRLAGRLAERFFGQPSRRLKLVGITGTNGKTTTAYLVRYLLGQVGVRCGLLGTVEVDDGAERRPAELTTPGAIELSRLLARMVSHGCAAAVMEVSSHALDQGRTDALSFDAAVFTNLTGDHLDYHGTMDAYADAKARLFERLGPEAWAVVNGDDPAAERMIARCPARVVRCGLEEAADAESAAGRADCCRVRPLALEADHSRAIFDGPWGSVEVRLPLVGVHNLMNTVQALAAANAVASLAHVVRSVLASCPAVPGRLEPVGPGWPEPAGRELAAVLPAVLVDYAHTHDALENVLRALGPVTRGRLRVLFGCGGDRDRTKRPRMAAVACAWADQVLVTSDNPRTEDPRTIIEEILAGVPAAARSKVTVEADRARAIAQIVAQAGPDDTVLLAGKGHEDYQILGRAKHPFDDRLQAAAALRRRCEAAAVVPVA